MIISKCFASVSMLHSFLSGNMSLVQIESRQVWLSNLLKKLGLIDADDKFYQFDGQGNDIVDDDNGDDYLVKLDPKDWKNQDHYAIFGFKNKRFFTTDDELKKSCNLFIVYSIRFLIINFLDRKKVLNHHPDKRMPGQQVDLDHDYYSCITKGISSLYLLIY